MSKKHTYNFIKEKIEKEGYQLLSDEYKNNRTKLKIKCPKGHIYHPTYDNFNQGHRCPECGGKKKLSYESVKEYIEKEGYRLLTKYYKNNKTKLKVRCGKEHEYHVTLNDFKMGHRCPECAGLKKYTYGYVKEYIESFGYQLLSKGYIGANAKLKVRCPEGHVYKVSFGGFKYGYRCPVCFAESTSSKAENDISEIFKQLYNGEIILNDRTQITNPETGCNLELDIWLPELNKAIEFNGIYWHSFPDTKRRDKLKKQQCVEKGIDLLIINEEIWITNKEQCLNNIQEFIKREVEDKELKLIPVTPKKQ